MEWILFFSWAVIIMKLRYFSITLFSSIFVLGFGNLPHDITNVLKIHFFAVKNTKNVPKDIYSDHQLTQMLLTDCLIITDRELSN